jgi:hypothetical protein
MSHKVCFYQTDNFLINKTVGLARAALTSDEAIVAIATEQKCRELKMRLQVQKSHPSGVWRYSEQYFALDVHETLSSVMVGDSPNEAIFIEVISSTLKQASDLGNGAVWVFSELSNILAGNGNYDAAVRIEELLSARFNNIDARTCFYCCYNMCAFPTMHESEVFLKIRNFHSHVAPLESYTPPKNTDEFHRMKAELQQKAMALDL